MYLFLALDDFDMASDEEESSADDSSEGEFFFFFHFLTRRVLVMMAQDIKMPTMKVTNNQCIA